MKLYHKVHALGFVIFFQVLSKLYNWPIKPINGHISSQEGLRDKIDPHIKVHIHKKVIWT